MAEEYAYHVDKNNKVIGKVTKKDILEKKLTHRGTTIYVFNSKGEILITKRAKRKKLYPGLLEIGQGGSMSYGEGYEEGAIRELKEETGIENVELEYIFDFSYTDDQVSYFAKTYKCIYDGEISVQDEEIDDYFFIPVEELKDMISKEPKKFSPDSVTQFMEYLRLISSK